MKRLYQLVAAVVVAFLVPVLASAPTYAASTCDIGFTGPDSKNMCTSVEKYSCEVQNENNVTIKNSNDQTVASGTVSVNDNNSGGSSASGSVSNSSGTNFSVTITNAGEGEAGICSASVVVTAVETPPTVVPGNGAATSPTPTAVPQSAVKVLPATGDDSTLMITTVIAGITTLTAAISVVTATLYRRLNAS